MIAFLNMFFHVLVSPFKTLARLEAEIVVLRHQLNVLRRRVPSRPKLAVADRLLFVWLHRLFPLVLNVATMSSPRRSIVLDMDSSVSPTHGDHEGTAYNGHFACTRYHPLFVFNQFGDLEQCALRPGNVHSADGWKNVLEPVVARYRERGLRRYFRADAAFANPEVYEFLEAEGYKYTIRLPANRILQERIGYLLKRPVGRPR
jgi:hypothetical protein